MVLYRKYRPQSLNELTGQEVVKKALVSAYLSQKVAHAYLFTGPRGTGKTSTARILAKMVNCAKVDLKTASPCNACPSCLSITDGSNLDLVEIDAASNRGIDDIRALRETIKLAPTASSKKVYIIDEVHMLTTEAFNALLKTLEEPPTHVLFILATTDLQKVPQTILSRVARLEFKLAAIDEVKDCLKDIAQKEKINIDDEALVALAKLSGGSFRDGVKLLDQVSSFEKVSLEVVSQTFGQGQFEKALEVLKLSAQDDSAPALELLSQIINSGVGVREFANLCLEVLRQLLLIHHGLSDQLVKTNYAAGQFQGLMDLSKQVNLQKVILMIDSFQKALEQLKFTTIQILPLEVAIVSSGSEYLHVRVSEEKRDKDVMLEGVKRPIASSLIASANAEHIASLQNDSSDPLTRRSTDDIKVIHDRWQYILETIKPHNFSLEALLRSVVIKEVTERVVLIEVPYSFHQRILAAPKSRDLLESVLSDVLGRTIKVSTILGERPQRSEDLMNIEVAQDDEIVRIAAEIFNLSQE